MKYSQYFERRKRADGGDFVAKKDNAPQELNDLIMNIHINHFFCSMSNDWINDTVHSAFLDQEDGGEVSPEADYYNSELCKWLRNGLANGFWSEAIEDGSVRRDIWNIAIEYLSNRRVYQCVYEFIKDHATREE